MRDSETKNTVEHEKSISHFLVCYALSLEQVKGIEPSTQAWEARILPLNYTCADIEFSFYIINLTARLVN